MVKQFLIMSGIGMFLGVAFGAFGAHGLKQKISQDVPELSIGAIENANSEEQLEKVANYFMGIEGEKK